MQITYHQNALNQRVAKEVDGEVVEKYLWKDLTTLLAVYDGNDNLLQRFTYTSNRMPTSMSTTTGIYYLHYDQVGTLRLVSNQQSQVVKEITYDTFGTILSDTNTSLNIPFGFAGGLHDRDTNLVHFGYREYDPQTGKWTAKDPIDFSGGDSNLYGYVLGDPVGFIDPSGEFGIAGGAYGAVSGAIGGYIAGGNWQSAFAGGIAGATIGLINPFSSRFAGQAVGNAMASLGGQVLGNAQDKCKKWNDLNYGAAIGAGLGGGWAGRGPLPSMFNKMPQPFPIFGATVEGAKIGIGEAMGANFGR